MKVLPDTPASDAGLRRNDVVIEMRGRAIRTADEAKQVVDESSVGDVLTLKVSPVGYSTLYLNPPPLTIRFIPVLNTSRGLAAGARNVVHVCA